MDKIAKALKKLLPKEKNKSKNILEKLDKNDFSGLDIVKLRGNKNIYRARQGNIRIIFTKNEDVVKILTVERRSDNV